MKNMQTDTRKSNSYFCRTEISKYLREYAGAISYGLNRVDEDDLEKAKDLLRLTLAKSGRVFVGGNGGSASISDHLVCDFTKGTHTENHNGIQVHSLVGSTSLFSAIGNDLGYDRTLSYQLELAQATSKDCLILISSSGNSANIIQAADYARTRGMEVVGLTGFSGGLLKNMVSISLHIPVHNYGVVEDCHQALMHILAQFHYVSFSGK